MKASSVAGVVLACTVASATPSIAQDGMAGGPWSGFYLGANVGDAFKPSDLSFRDLSDEQDLTFHSGNNGDSILAGVHAGYGWWNGKIYTGIEGDADWGQHINYLASVRGRLGFGNDRWLFYGTAGIGFLGTKDHFTAISADEGPSSFSRSVRATGFVGGAGLEYALGPRTTLGIEGLWYGFGSDRHTLTTPFAESFSVRDDHNFAAVRARLTYYFNG